VAGARGKTVEFDPVQVAGLDDKVWQKEGSSTNSMGVLFSLRGEVVKAPGIAPLVYKWIHRNDKQATPVNPFAGTPIVSVGTFQRDGATDLLLEFNGGIYHLDGNVVTKLIDGRYLATTPFESTRFVQAGNVLLILNGKDPNLKWDGVKLSPLGIAEVPTAPIIAERDPGHGSVDVNTGSAINDANPDLSLSIWSGFAIKKNGAVESDPYRYKLVWVNDAGQESEPSAASNTVTDIDVRDGALYTILVANLSDRPPSDDINGRILYRSMDNISYYEIAYLPGTSTDTYFDYIEPGLTLSAPMKETGTNLPPPLSKWAFEFRGRTYYGGVVEDPLLLYYSEPNGAKEAVKASNFILISSDGSGDEITGYGMGSDYALIFTNRSTHMLTHDKGGNPIMTPVSRSIGAVSDRSVVGFGSRTFFIGEAGLYAFDGSKVVPLTNKVSEQVKNLPQAHLKDVVGWADPINRRVYFSVVTGASSVNNEVWSIHVDTGAVSKQPFPVTAAVQYKGETIVGFNYPDAAGSPVYDLGVWGASNSLGRSDAGYEGSFETRWITGKSPQSDKTYFRLDVFYVQTANKDMTVTWHTDWDRDAVGSTTFKLCDPNALTWDEVSGGSTITWGDLYQGKTWDEARVRCKRINFSVSNNTEYPSDQPLTAKCIKITFSTSADKTPWKLVGFVLHSEDHGIRGEGTD
jgi:hypothetical protein